MSQKTAFFFFSLFSAVKKPDAEAQKQTVTEMETNKARNRPAASSLPMSWDVFVETLFREAEPFLEARGDLLHTRVAHRFALLLMASEGGDPALVEPAVILHDVGWSAVDRNRIRGAYGVHAEGRESAEQINRIHEIEGAAIAKRILESHRYDAGRIDRIVRIIERHDSGTEADSLEEKLVKDADKLWRYSKEGFWKEIERQGVDPGYFHQRLIRRRKEWFMTPSALEIAKRELKDREKEVREVTCPDHRNDNR
jgi:HD superfamily phosphohydrolase YqeK